LSRRGRIAAWGLALAVLAGVVAFFVSYHPPMRLMPAPLLFQQADLGALLRGPAPAVGSGIGLFYATSRLPIGPQDNRLYSVIPDGRLHLGRAEMSIGGDGVTLADVYEWTVGAPRTDRPFIHLRRMVEYASIPSERTSAADAPLAGPERAWFEEIDAALGRSRRKDLLVYVHGANTTVERAAGQASQLRHFSGQEAVVVLFAWPTAENFLRYARDVRNAYGSAPRLAELLALLSAHTSAQRIDVFTYSAGSTVGSRALALAATSAAAPRLGQVFHAAPDADFRGFVDDAGAYAGSATRVTTALNLGDSALRLSALVNRASRAGRPDLRELEPQAEQFLRGTAADSGIDIVIVRAANIPGLSARSHTFWYDDPWVSSDVLLTLLLELPPGRRGLQRSVTGAGVPYWTFPTDYPERMPALRDALRARGAGG
jgi:esterase/lipase superfamily enzyme